MERYSGLFCCCEINSTFYRFHKPETWARWAATVPAEFRFSVKAPKAITHQALLACGPEILEPFAKEITGLGEKLGPVLFQLPPRLVFDSALAKGFFTVWQRVHFGATVCEPRHESWFAPDAGALLRDLGIARVAADPARVPSAASPGGATSLPYYRLHGSPRMYYSSYSPEFLDEIARGMSTAGREAWCIFDNTASGAAAENAMQLDALLKRIRR